MCLRISTVLLKGYTRICNPPVSPFRKGGVWTVNSEEIISVVGDVSPQGKAGAEKLLYRDNGGRK